MNTGVDARGATAAFDGASCKICGRRQLAIAGHTARCSHCGVLLYYPYPSGSHPSFTTREEALSWYTRSAAFNHVNFTRMLRFAAGKRPATAALSILDFGGGGGQFALVCRSHYPLATVYLVDVNDDSALAEWKPFSKRLAFRSFPDDATRFDFIFLNDVFEHLDDPVSVLRMLAGKLAPGGKIFIDTPRQFWIYPLTRWLSRELHLKVLRGTVSPMHLQIWSTRSFRLALERTGLRAEKVSRWAEFTMPADFYLDNMGITQPLVRFAGRAMYAAAGLILRNKIVCVLGRPDSAGSR